MYVARRPLPALHHHVARSLTTSVRRLSRSDLFTAPPEPKTLLGRHRILSPNAGIRVSPLQLGAMSIGNAWSSFMGSMDKQSSFALLDAYLELGGNTIDTASNYQNEQSEIWVGEWMKERGNRDQIVLATKFTNNYRSYSLGKHATINNSGNSKRSLHVAVRDSLKKLQTEWIDILYVHWWDHTTSIEELMCSLHTVVQQGKVLYLGISDAPAWVVSACNMYAKDHALTPFVIYQGRMNVMTRDLESDVIPMCRNFGMALAVWDSLGGGHLQSKKQLEARKAAGEALRSTTGSAIQSPEEEKYSEVLEMIASRHGIGSVTAVALAYVMSKTPYVFPIVGGRKIEHLKDNIQALSIKLTDEDIAEIESVKPYAPPFPHTMIGDDPRVKGKIEGNRMGAYGNLDFVPHPKPIGRA